MLKRVNPLIYAAILLALLLVAFLLLCQPGKAQEPEPNPFYPYQAFMPMVQK